MYALLDFMLLFQPSASSAMGGSSGSAGPAGGCAGAGGSSSMLMALAVLAVFYFVTIRPQKQQQDAHDALLKKLKVGDVVRTDSGIRGEITKLGERDVDIEIAKNTRINILRTRVAGLEGQTAADTAQSNQPKG